MIQSINTKSIFTTTGYSYHSNLGYKPGDIMLGDKAFEFYNKYNIEDFIQIPYTHITQVQANVIFNRFIRQFIIITSQNGSFHFSSHQAKEILSHMKRYIDPNKITRTQSILRVIKYMFVGK